jgi:Tol biopolymer transport system component
VTIANFERGGVGVRSARWSPDGLLVAYATDCGYSYESHCGVIATVQPDGHRKRVLDTPLAGNSIGRDESPTWSPEGTRIAFVRTWPEPAAVYAVDRNGGGLTQLAGSGRRSLAWSPDGSRFAFWKQPGTVFTGVGEIATANVDGSGEVVLASGAPVVAANPDWSPDSKKIAFTQLRGQLAWVCVIPSSGGRVRCLVRGGQPAWSPDGRYLVYTHARDIWVVRADGTHARNVTRTPYRRESAPDWQPR